MSTLTDRYVAAAMRSVPEKQRPDLAAELRASIDDQLEARVAAGEPHDAAERAVLTDLGDPDRLAADYTDRPLYLIGPRYYLTWWRLTKLLWAIVPACVAVAVALGQTLAGESVGGIIGSVVSAIITVVAHVGFWTTLVFFIVERSAKGGDAEFVRPWTLDDLPEPKHSGAGLADMVASLIMLAAVAGAVVWDHFFGFVYFAGEGWTPFLAAGLWPGWVTFLFVLLALEAVLAIRVYVRGRWEASTAVANVVLNVAVTIPAIWLLREQRLLNPDIFPALIPGNGETVATVVAVLFGVGVVGIAVWDSIDGFLKARRAAGSTRARAAGTAE